MGAGVSRQAPICHDDLVGKCTANLCRYRHIRSINLPYIWQIWKSDMRLTLHDKQIIQAEKAYCKRRFKCQIEVFHGDKTYNVSLTFPRNDKLKAHLQTANAEPDLEKTADVRRLSTESYAKDMFSTEKSFKTQWRWFFLDDFETWLLYEPDLLQLTLERKYVNMRQKTYIFYRHDYHFKYRLDFDKMVQTNITTGKQRKVLRRPLFVSEEDVQAKSFPEMIPRPDAATQSVPACWLPWDLAHPFEFVELEQNSPQFVEVKNSFFSTLSHEKFHINYIHRVQNINLWRAYTEQRKTMKLDLERDGRMNWVNQKSLYHGTNSEDSVRGICINCFDFRICGKHGTVFGKGAYFARDASCSHSYTTPSSNMKQRFMFRAKVLVGEYAVGSPSYVRPPQKQGGSAHQLYDSCVDDVYNPSIFVVFDLRQCYPEYLICYEEVTMEVHSARASRVNVGQPPLKLKRSKTAGQQRLLPLRRNYDD